MPYIIIALIALPITYYITSYNGFKTREVKTDESLSGIDVALSKRYSLITNLVETVKGYTKHERETLELVTQLRSINNDEPNHYNQALTSAKDRLMILVENYPEIKADTNYLHLQKSLTDCEEHLQAARRLHNRNVADYNTYIQLSPRNLIPIIKSASTKPYFEAKTDERESVAIKL